MLLEVGLAIVLALLLRAITNKHDSARDIYRKPGFFYRIKWIIFYAMHRWRLRNVYEDNECYDHGSDLRFLEDEGVVNKPEIIDNGHGMRTKMGKDLMERTQTVADSKFAIDAVYFNGFQVERPTVSEDVSLVMGFTNRFRDYAEILFFVNVPGVGFLQHPAHPDRIICDASSDEYQYHGQGMTLEMLEPMRRWRIKYNGLMRLMDVNERHVTKKSDTLIHVKLSFTWASYSDVVNFDKDISPSCMANAFACEDWTGDFFDRVKRIVLAHYAIAYTYAISYASVTTSRKVNTLNSTTEFVIILTRDHAYQTHYEQWGQLQGVLQVENQEPKELLMRGLRDHSFSKREWRQFHRYLICMIYLEDGTSISLSSICMDRTLSRLTMGYIVHPNHQREAIDHVDIRLWEFGEDGKIPREVYCNFTAGGKKYHVVCQIRIIPEYYNGFEWEGKIVETLADYYVNGVPGRGIAEFTYRHDHDLRTIDDCPKSETKIFKDSITDQSKILALTLEENLCQKESLVGGKGSQVASLTNWSKETDKFVVPSGFCLTTNAYQFFVEQNKELENIFGTLEEEISTYSTDQLKHMCSRIMGTIEKAKMSDELSSLIEERYTELNKAASASVAVRSSAIGEDGVDISAAGQLETFLGVSGLEDVKKYIKKCWACQYCYNAVEYRRQHGQPTLSTMGVLVQCLAQQVKAAGVMFTQHPVTGHPMHVMINCNYGLGETVVSGSAEPDTIVVHHSQNNNKKIIQKDIGTKKTMMKVIGNGTVKELDVTPDEASTPCLSDQEIFDLVDVGDIVQRFSGSARDIEWAISIDGEISLLQSRPVTGDPTETDFEMMHEFDSALSNNNYFYTTANLGEMMPGPVTPLTGSVFLRSLEYSLQMLYEPAVPRGPFWFNDLFHVRWNGHLFMNYTEMLKTNEYHVTLVSKDSLDVNLFGKVRTEVSLEQIAKYHGRSGFLRRIVNAIRFYWHMYSAEREFDQLVERCKHFELNGKDAKSLYKSISENMTDIYAESWVNYLGYAAASGTSTTILMMILSQGKSGQGKIVYLSDSIRNRVLGFESKWKTEHYSDVAMIYGSCENLMESADAPTLIEKISELIYKSDDRDAFLAKSPEDAIEWLMSQKGEAGMRFQEFLQYCGHRCIREAELREKSWRSDPNKLGASLQVSVRNYAAKKQKNLISVADSIAKLKTPLSFLGRNILKLAIPKARKSVAGRENGKSRMIKICDGFKRGYWKLAGMLEKEGYLPEADLTFFLTHGEIGRLLRTRSALLVGRANKRRRFYNDSKKLNFDEFHSLFPPRPTNVEEEIPMMSGDIVVNGFPVSHGTVKGLARIVLSLEDTHEIQKGDVLIVRTTDVGWTPYFPLISGLVTEIGGLISHGATVAREFGLPCIVGAKRATQLFNSGDLVFLDGGKGIIRKVESAS